MARSKNLYCLSRLTGALLFCICAVTFVAVSAPRSLAAASPVVAGMSYPETGKFSIMGYTVYKVAYIAQYLSDGVTYTHMRYQILTVDSDLGDPYIDWQVLGGNYVGSPRLVFSGSHSSNLVSNEFNEIDILTGSVTYSYIGTVGDNSTWTQFLASSTSYWPNAEGDNMKGVYFIYDDTFQYMSWTDPSKLSEPFVSWGVSPPDQLIKRSHLPEPKADLYNRYFVSVGEEDSFLYWINIRDNSYYNYLNDISLASDSPFFDGYLFNPTLTITSFGVNLTLDVDSTLIQLTASQDAVVSYTVTVSKYVLETGEIVSSQVLSDVNVYSSSINITPSGIFTDFSDWVAIYDYGLVFLNANDRQVLNLASVIWSVDPVVEDWRSAVFSILQDILNVLNGSDVVTSTVTYPDIAGDLQQAEDDLAITTPDGGQISPTAANEFFEDSTFPFSSATNAFNFLSVFYDDFIQPNQEIVVLLTVLIALSVVAVILGLVI